MTKVTYYAEVTGARTRTNPSALLRRIESDPPREEELRRDLQWHRSAALALNRMGQVDYDYEEITEAEAEAIIARWRVKFGRVGPSDGG